MSEPDHTTIQDPCEACDAEESVKRGLICQAALQHLGDAASLAYEGLAFFAMNERHRRTFFALQKDTCSRPPDYNPKHHEWDYSYSAVTPATWAKRNPFGLNRRPPGTDYSYTENPAEERMNVMLDHVKAVENQVAEVVEPLSIRLGRLVADLCVAEVRGRRRIEAEASIITSSVA